MAVTLEKRPYGPDASDEEVEALRSRVTSPYPNVIIYREPPVVSRFSIDVFWDRIRELTAGLESYSIIVDITETKPPGAELRFHIREVFESINPQRVAVFTGKNQVINVVAKFIMRSMFKKQLFSIHETLDEALSAVEAVPGVPSLSA